MTPFVPSRTCTWAEVKLTISVATILHCFGFLHSFHLSHKHQRSSDVLVQEVSFHASSKSKFSKTVSSIWPCQQKSRNRRGKKKPGTNRRFDLAEWGWSDVTAGVASSWQHSIPLRKKQQHRIPPPKKKPSTVKPLICSTWQISFLMLRTSFCSLSTHFPDKYPLLCQTTFQRYFAQMGLVTEPFKRTRESQTTSPASVSEITRLLLPMSR